MNENGMPFSMPSDASLHSKPLLLWQCACGGRELPKRDYQHIIDCKECETLATEIGEALVDLEKTLRKNHPFGSAS